MMMFYRRKASPKHRYDIIEVDYGGGGHRTWLRDQWSIVVSMGCPLPPYIKEQGEEAAGQGEARQGGVLLPLGLGLLLFLVGVGEGEGKGEGEKERGGWPPLP